MSKSKLVESPAGEEQEPTFEEAIGRLEGIVAGLESGSFSLDESLAQFETAVGLSRRCASLLETADKKLQVLTEEGLRPYQPDGQSMD